MTGKRVYPDLEKGDHFPLMQPGEYRKHAGIWHAETPNGYGANLMGHQVTEHEDGTITVSPSILVSSNANPERIDRPMWHGFLERGVWREC